MIQKTSLDNLAGMIKRGFDNVDKKFDNVDKKFDNVDKKFDDVDKKFEEQRKAISEDVKRYIGVLTEDFDSKVQMIVEQYESINEKLDSHENRLFNIEKNIEIMKVDISFIKGSLKQKVDVEDFSVLERRVILIEAKLKR